MCLFIWLKPIKEIILAMKEIKNIGKKITIFNVLYSSTIE